MSNLIVVLIGITFYLGLSHFDLVREKLDMFLSVVAPFIVGFAVAYLLNTPAKFLERELFAHCRHRRTWSIISVYLLAVLLLVVLLNLILPQVWSSAVELVNKMPEYMKGLDVLVQELITRFDLGGEGINELLVSYQELMAGLTEKTITAVSEALPQILNFGVAVGNGVITGVTALIASIYMLSGKERLVPQLKKLIYAIFPTEKASWFLSVCSQANNVFVGFINGKLIDSAIIGVLCFVLNLILQIPYNILIAVVIGVTNVIPFFGPFIGAIPATLLILIQNPIKALWFVLFVLVLQQVDGNIIGPKILGNTTGLSSFWVLFAILLFGGLWGFVGMIVGVPLFAVIYDVIKKLVIHGLQRHQELTLLNSYHDQFGDPADDAAAQPVAPQSAENQ